MKRLILIAGVGLLLSACGGGNDASSGNDAVAHAQQQVRKSPTVPHLTQTDLQKIKRQADAPARGVKQQQPSDYEYVVESLYVAYFGRPADPNGLVNFEASLAADNAPTDVQGLLNAYATDTTVQNLVDAFGTSQESQNLYGTGNPSNFVNTVFNNLLNRAPLSAGATFWTTEISNGSVTQGEAALSIMVGALTNNSAQGQLDGQLIVNRITAAEYFTDQLASLNDTYAYAGASAAQTARSALATVTASTSSDTYQATLNTAISTLVANAPPSGSASPYVQTDGFFTWIGSENGTVVLDYQDNQYSVDFDSGVVVDLASNQQLNGLTVDGNADLVFNGTIIGGVVLVQAVDGNQVAQFSYTANGQNGTALITVNTGSYTVTCGDCGN